MEEKIVYTITVRTNQDSIRAAAIIKNIRHSDGTFDSTLTTAFAQEDLDLLMEILDGKKPISTAMGGGVHAD